MNNMISVRDVNRSFEAHNFNLATLGQTIRPWFKDLHDDRIEQAIDDLANETMRASAMDYLGLEFIA
ncbi:hypothetical protein BSR29_04240 [Boudabousia liubingyangii]|uniref:Uncharacterized protein n=1 Tax=Boudabousia liubingyangii TaxID=1921764 RepID=A0A1Q5PNE1_9ACTO|nr:hypothetical protein [Boudabousia liubingyangii]OKL47624.1 hypothetical protein BSR28_03810 [Boudabousia liubingyangii]OKL49049.1 hypothetical protein BSR29_04240 [Boudabousia liubingyangii]